MGREYFYKTPNFGVFVPQRPHVSREEGGHICIMYIGRHKCSSRLDLTPSEAKEFTRLSMLVGEAMLRGMKKRGVKIAHINYQENGNWPFLHHEKPVLHMHLYGRTADSFQQRWGEALYFPDPGTSFYDHITPLDQKDVVEILSEIKKLEFKNQYAPENWA